MAAVPPTPAEQQIILLLQRSLDALRRIGNPPGGGGSGGNRRNKSLETLVNSLERIEENTNKLGKELGKSQKELGKVSRMFGKSLSDMIKDALIPANRKIRETIREFNESYQDIVRNQSESNKKLARSTRDYVKTNKDAVKNIKSSTSAFRDYSNLLKNIAKSQAKVTRNDVDRLSDLSKIINKLSTETGGRVNADRLGYMNRVQNILNLLAAQNKKISRENLQKLLPIIEKIGTNIEVITSSTNLYVKAYAKSVRELKETFKQSMQQMINGIKTAIVSAAPQMFKDLAAQAKNAVAESNYSEAFKLGVSQADLAEFIGKNRFNLRSMTGKSATDLINDGSIDKLQNYAYKFGLTGGENLKFVGSTINNMINMGIKPTVDNIKVQMDSFYEIIKSTGLTFDELDNLVSDISSNPAFLQLSQAKGYVQDEQISIFVKMLKTQGYSAEYLKQILELNKSQQYQGIEEAIKSIIGIDLLSGQINRSLGYNAISKDQIMLMQESTRGLGGLIELFNSGAYSNVSYNGQKFGERFTGPTAASDFAAFVTKEKLRINKLLQQSYATNAANVNRIGGLVNNTLLTKFGGLAGPEFEQTDASLVAQARAKGLTGTTAPNLLQQFTLLGENDKDMFITSVNDLRNALIPLGDTVNETVFKIQEGLKGFSENPGGKAAQGIGSAIKGIAGAGGSAAGLLMLQRYLGGGAGLGRLGGLLGVIGPAAAGGARILGIILAAYGLYKGIDYIDSIPLNKGELRYSEQFGRSIFNKLGLPTAPIQSPVVAPITKLPEFNNLEIPENISNADLEKILEQSKDELEQIKKLQQNLYNATLEIQKQNMDIKIKESNDAKIQNALDFSNNLLRNNR